MSTYNMTFRMPKEKTIRRDGHKQVVPKMGLEPTNLLITSELLYRLELLRLFSSAKLL